MGPAGRETRRPRSIGRMYPVCNNPQKMKDLRFRSSGSRIIMRYPAGAMPAGAAWTQGGLA